MSLSRTNTDGTNTDEDPSADLLAAEDAAEEITPDDDQPMSDGDDDADADEEVILQNDSVAHFDQHRDSIFAIAQHPLRPTLIATGGSEGPEDDAPGMGYLVDTSSAPERPVLPASFKADPTDPSGTPAQTKSLSGVGKIGGHKDSITALAWGLPGGEVLFSGGMDGRLAAWRVKLGDDNGAKLSLLGEASEVKEITWLAACPNPTYSNTVALGADDGSVWVYTADPSAKNPSDALTIVQSYFLHTSSSTAGAWTPDGNLLVTVSDDGSLYAWDVWGVAAAKKLTDKNGTTAVSLTTADGRFAVEEGLFSLAIEPKGTYAAVGGAGGAIRIVSLPSLSGGAQGKGKQAKATPGGQILAALNVQSDSIESLSFTAIAPNTVLLAAGCVDGSIAVFEASRRFASRRQIANAHDGLSVVKVDFVPGTWSLTSCGMDGVVRRWDLRGGGGQGNASGNVAEAGMVGEWRGHRGGGEGGGVMGFVQGSTGARIITAGDDGLLLVFDA